MASLVERWGAKWVDAGWNEKKGDAEYRYGRYKEP